LTEDDTSDLIALRGEALQSEPLAFGSSPEDDRLTLESVQKALADSSNQAVFGFYEAHKLSGMIGILRTGKMKERHKAHIWGMYVSPASRRKGAGSALLRAAIQKAAQWAGVSQIHLSVTEAAPDAKRLYERAGFQQWGREPQALCVDGRFVDELHLVLKL
jgi:ribosomal protein S18 acetylase RimI-like enzyme